MASFTYKPSNQKLFTVKHDLFKLTNKKNLAIENATKLQEIVERDEWKVARVTMNIPIKNKIQVVKNIVHSKTTNKDSIEV